MDLSLVIPVYNEETIVRKNIEQFLESFKFTGSFEIILSNNGSQDTTLEKAKELEKKYSFIKVVTTSKRSIGRALKEGVTAASGNLIFWGGIDFPFGFDIVDHHLSNQTNYDLTIGSKYHPLSINNSPLKRKIISWLYHAVLYVIFGLKIKDPQGSFLFKKEVSNKVLPFCTYDSAFLETQFVLYSNLFGYRIKEIPVRYINPRRKSKFSIIVESSLVLRDIIREVPIFYGIKKSN